MSDVRTHSIDTLSHLNTFAQQFVAALQANDIVFLCGDLGAGKTTLVQAVGQVLGVHEPITSPTFTIVGEYTVPDHVEITQLIHVDLYRLADASAAHDPLVHEILAETRDGGRLTMIEWAEKLGQNILQDTERFGGQAWVVRLQVGATAGARTITVDTWPSNRNWH